MTDNYVEKTILDRNGNPKSIRVKVSGSGVIRPNPAWRGLEYGWTAEDSTPENDGTVKRQSAQDWVVAHGGEVIARHFKIGKKYVPLAYAKGDFLVFVTQQGVSIPTGWKKWAESAGWNTDNVLVQDISEDHGINRHSFQRMS